MTDEATLPVYYRVQEDVYLIGVELIEVKVIKLTKCGAWVEPGWGINPDTGEPYRKFVNNSWKKRWAYPTVEEAKKAFTKRKEKQVRILESQLYVAKEFARLDLSELQIKKHVSLPGQDLFAFDAGDAVSLEG